MLILWTDALVYLLVVAAVLLGVYMSRQAHMRRPLHKIAVSPVAMASLTLLLCFVMIGLADSIHFKDGDSNGNDTISLLDVACQKMLKQTEKNLFGTVCNASLCQGNHRSGGRFHPLGLSASATRRCPFTKSRK